MPPHLRRRRSLSLSVACALGAFATRPAIRAAPIALWHFDDPAREALALGPGVAIVPGKFGGALRPAATTSAVRGNAAAASADPALAAKLNLGAHDWTLECWLWLDAAAQDEGVVFEVGLDPVNASDLVTRISVWPRENAFALTSVTTSVVPPPLGAKRVDYPRADGPASAPAYLQTTTLAASGPLPRETWFHVALVHAAETHALRLYLDGKLRAVGKAELEALPLGGGAHVAIGSDGRGGRALRGRIDELRISDEVVYRADFTPRSQP